MELTSQQKVKMGGSEGAVNLVKLQQATQREIGLALIEQINKLAGKFKSLTEALDIIKVAVDMATGKSLRKQKTETLAIDTVNKIESKD